MIRFTKLATIGALVISTILGSARAELYICGGSSDCPYTYINPVTGLPTTARAAPGTILDTGAGYQVRTADNWARHTP